MTALERSHAHAPDFSTVRAPYLDRQRLGAELRRMSERGEIERCGPIVLKHSEGGVPHWEAHYVRLREPRPRLPRYAAAFAIGAGALVSVGAMLWHARYVILYGALGMAALALLIVLAAHLGQHRAGCPGIITHCPGCKG